VRIFDRGNREGENEERKQDLRFLKGYCRESGRALEGAGG
jgi:hypothetical protein